MRRLQMSMDIGHVRCMMKDNALAVYHCVLCVTRSEQTLYCRRLCPCRLSDMSFEVFSISQKRPLKTQDKLDLSVILTAFVQMNKESEARCFDHLRHQ